MMPYQDQSSRCYYVSFLRVLLLNSAVVTLKDDFESFLSHNWLMLKRLCFSPSTNSTSLISNVFPPPTSLVPSIFPLLLSPYVTNPCSFLLKFLKFLLSPVKIPH